jgi:hypothetical protein
VLLTATIQLLLWRDKRIAAKAEAENSSSSQGSDSPPLHPADIDGKQAIDVKEVRLGSVE